MEYHILYISNSFTYNVPDNASRLLNKAMKKLIDKHNRKGSITFSSLKESIYLLIQYSPVFGYFPFYPNR